MKRITFTGLIVVIAVTLLNIGGLGSNHAAAAGSATFSLSPSASTVNIHSVFGVTVYENGTDVNVVTADLTYDASKLEFVSIDASGSAFANSVSGSGGGGSVGISRYTAPGTTVSGNQKVATVNFKAVAGSGTASVAMAGSSKIASNGVDTWNHAAVSATYTLATPAPAPTPTPAPVTTNPAPTPKTAQQANNPASPNAVLDINAQQAFTLSEQPETATPEAPVQTIATVSSKRSNVFTYVALGVLALLVAAVVIVRKLVQNQQASVTKKPSKAAAAPTKNSKKPVRKTSKK